MIAAVQALMAPLLAAVQARIALAAGIIIRRAVFLFAAALFGVGALMFLSVGVILALSSSLGPAGAVLVMAVIWALLAGVCVLISRPRPSTVVAATAPVAAMPPAAAPHPAAPPPYATHPPYPPSSTVPPSGVPPVAPVGPVAPASRIARLRTRINRAAPLLAIGALAAGIIAGRR